MRKFASNGLGFRYGGVLLWILAMATLSGLAACKPPRQSDLRLQVDRSGSNKACAGSREVGLITQIPSTNFAIMHERSCPRGVPAAACMEFIAQFYDGSLARDLVHGGLLLFSADGQLVGVEDFVNDGSQLLKTETINRLASDEFRRLLLVLMKQDGKLHVNRCAAESSTADSHRTGRNNCPYYQPLSESERQRLAGYANSREGEIRKFFEIYSGPAVLKEHSTIPLKVFATISRPSERAEIYGSISEEQLDPESRENKAVAVSFQPGIEGAGATVLNLMWMVRAAREAYGCED